MKIIEEFLDYSKWPDEDNIHLFTANRVVKANGRLVMGAGNALACLRAHPNIDDSFGICVEHQPHDALHIVKLPNDYGYIGAFMVKNHWREPASTKLLTKAVAELNEVASSFENMTFHLPYPCIGYGGMQPKDVYEYIRRLPDNVLVYIGDKQS